MWFLCVSTLQHRPFWTTAEWGHGVATCLTLKNRGLVLRFQVLVQVSKIGLLAIAYWREQTAKERLLTRTKICQKFLCSPKLIACSQLWNKGLFETRIHGLGSGTCIVTLYIGGFAVIFGVMSVPLSHPGSRNNSSAWASSPSWGSSNLHLLCRIIGYPVKELTQRGSSPHLWMWSHDFARKGRLIKPQSKKQEAAWLLC